MAGSECPQQTRFPLGQHVEVLQRSKDLRGSWQLATIVTVTNGRRDVEYNQIFQSDGVHRLRESFSVRKDSDIANKCWLEKCGKRGFLRPLAPVLNNISEWPKGLLVDAFQDGAWWEGVISEDTKIVDMDTIVKVLFPDRNKESLIRCMQLRASHQWDEFTGKWELRGYWKGFSPSGGKDTSYKEIQSVDLHTHQKGLAHHNQLSHVKDAEAGASSCQEDFKELIEAKRNAARQFFFKMGYTMEFHVRIGRGREAVYIAPHGRRFYSLTMACKAWKKEHNMPCNLEACKSKQEKLLCIYDLFPSPTQIESTEGNHKELNVVAVHANEVANGSHEMQQDSQVIQIAGPFCSKGKHGRGRKRCLGAEAGNCSITSAVTANADLLSSKPLFCGEERAKGKPGRKPKFKGSPLVNQGITSTSEKSSLFCPDEIPHGKTAICRKVKEKGQKAKCGRKPLFINKHKGITGCTTIRKTRKRRENHEATYLEVLQSEKTLIPEEINPAKVEAPYSKQGNKVSYGCQKNVCDYHDRGYHSPVSTITEASKGCKALPLCHSPTSTITQASKGCRAIMLSPGTSSTLTEANVRVEEKEKIDDICSACGDGGDLLLCDYCPSAYHAECVGLEVIPEGNWYCFGCCCASCEGFLFESEDGTLPITCTQCESKYHVNCSPSEGYHGKQDSSIDRWFCGLGCERVYVGLHRQLGISYPLEIGGLSWMLLKSNQPEECSALIRNKSKLSAAHAVLEECFVPMIDVCTGVDIISQALFSQGSKMNRLNCLGFYTLILERGCELISVATFRVHGSRLAEMPFIGTRFHHRRKGMCRRLMSVLEKMLQELGVRKLLLPAVPEILKTWREKFGFQYINSLDRMEVRLINLMRFPGTTILKKSMVRLPIESHSILPLNTQGSKPSGIFSEYKVDFKRRKMSTCRTQEGDLDVGDMKVVVATTKYMRLVKSPQWYVDSMKDLSNDVELSRKARRSGPCRRKLKKTIVDAKKSRTWAKHAAQRSRFKSSTSGNTNLAEGSLEIRKHKSGQNGLLKSLATVLSWPRQL